jgi:hypothetical protein
VAVQGGREVIRVERGQAGPEEMAVLVAVLLACGCAGFDAQPAGVLVARAAGWAPAPLGTGFAAPHSWRTPR